MLNKPKTILSLLATGLITWTLSSQQAHAVPISGAIAFSGSGTVIAGNPTTTINFGRAEDTAGGTGDYWGAGFGTDVTFKSITYTGTGYAATLTAPGTVSSLWKFTTAGITYSFDLTSLTFADISAGWLYNSGTLSGLGIAHVTGRENTLGTFSIAGGGLGYTFNFLSSSVANGHAVPDGGSTVVLLGFALVGVVGLHRNLRIITA
jgi:hypothetical protein